MTWKLKKEAEAMTPITGVPWQDMSDDEFDAVCKDYDKQFPESPRSLERWFTHEAEEKAKKGGKK